MTKIKATPLSRILVCSTRWLRDLISRGVLSAPVKGFFDLEKVVEEYIRFLKTSTQNQELQKLKAVHLSSRIRKLELETKLLEGDLVPISQAKDFLEEARSRFTQSHRDLPWAVGRALLQIRHTDEPDDIFIKIVVMIVRRIFADTTRYIFCGLPRETPHVFVWEKDLVKFGVVKGKGGKVIVEGSNGKKLVSVKAIKEEK